MLLLLYRSLYSLSGRGQVGMGVMGSFVGGGLQGKRADWVSIISVFFFLLSVSLVWLHAYIILFTHTLLILYRYILLVLSFTTFHIPHPSVPHSPLVSLLAPTSPGLSFAVQPSITSTVVFQPTVWSLVTLGYEPNRSGTCHRSLGRLNRVTF